MSLLLDASVLVPLFSQEDRSAGVQSHLRHAKASITISDFALGEVAAALGALMRRQVISNKDAERALANLDMFAARHGRAVTEPRDIAVAAGMVRRFDLGLRMPDALYIALAQRLRATVMTADIKLADAACALGVHIEGPEF